MGAIPPVPLLQRVREGIRVRHYSIRTEQAYCDWIKRLVIFHGKRHPPELGAAEVEALLTGIQLRHLHSAGAARALGREHDDDLYACAQSRGRGVVSPLDG
jgi:hypothetical protein